jgi:U5 small nuclear ribonucleoprotein component
MIACDPKGPLMIQIVKLYNKADCSSFDAFGRVFSGTLRVDEGVKVLGEGYTLEDQEDMTIKDISALWISESR